MSDVLVRFTADIHSRCIGDIVLLSADELESVDKEAKFLKVKTPYEVVDTSEAKADDTAPEEVETSVETGVEQPADETSVETAEEPAPVVDEQSDAPEEVETKSKSKKGSK